MAKLTNLTASKCETYLSIWYENMNDNVVPYYDKDNNVWEFEYFNGEICDHELPSSFYVYWFCNPDIIEPNYNIKKSQLDGTCLYELEIETRLACN